MRVSGQFYFFLQKGSTHTKRTKMHINKQKQKRQRFMLLKKHLRGRKSLIRLFAFLCFFCAFCAFYAFCAFLCLKQKNSIFVCIKTSKRKKIACLTFCTFCAFYAFYAHKKHLRGGSRLFLFCAFCAFLCVLFF